MTVDMSNYFTVQAFRRCTEIWEKMEASILAALLGKTVSGPTLRVLASTRTVAYTWHPNRFIKAEKMDTQRIRLCDLRRQSI